MVWLWRWREPSHSPCSSCVRESVVNTRCTTIVWNTCQRTALTCGTILPGNSKLNPADFSFTELAADQTINNSCHVARSLTTFHTSIDIYLNLSQEIGLVHWRIQVRVRCRVRAPPLSIKLLSFSCSLREKIDQITAWYPLWVQRSRLGNTGSTTVRCEKQPQIFL